jgi:hypothetical protein
MREKKKTLKLKKFKVANLHAVIGIRGGNSNPCQVNTGTPSQTCQPQHTDDCCSKDNSTCSMSHYLSDENNSCDLGAPTEGSRFC